MKNVFNILFLSMILNLGLSVFCQFAEAQTNWSYEFARAVKNEDIQMVEGFIQQGFDVNHPSIVFYLGRTPLHHAVTVNNVALVATLLEAGADTNAENNIRRTPLFTAAHQNQITIAEMLLDHEAGLSNTDAYGWNPLAFLERMITKNEVREGEDYTDMLELLQSTEPIQAND